MADRYITVGEDGATRYTGNPGSSTVLNGSGGDATIRAGGWKPAALTIGGGLLSYLIARGLLGSSDYSKKDGKKKSRWVEVLKDIIPFAAAAAGAAGGHYLSRIPSGAPGKKGELSVKLNDNGTIPEPKVPMSGEGLHDVRNIALGTSAATAGKAALNWRYTSPERLSARATRLAEEAVREGIRALDERRAGNIAGEFDAWNTARNLRDLSGMESARAAYRRSVRMSGTPWRRFVNFLSRDGRNALVRGYRGNAVAAITSALTAGVAHWVGSKMNKDREAVLKAIEAIKNGGQ